MSSGLGRTVFAVGGALAGAAIGNPFLAFGVQAALVVGASLLFPPKGIDAAPPDVGLPAGRPGRPLRRGHGVFPVNDLDLDFRSEPVVKKIKERVGKGSSKAVVGHQALVSLGFSVCEGEGEILKLWRQGKLIYDVTSGGATENLTGTLRLYTGTVDQDPDPAEQATFDVETVTGYPGVVRFTIEDHDISDAQPIPVFSALVARTATATFPTVSKSPSRVLGTSAITDDGNFIIAPDSSGVTVVNLGSGEIRTVAGDYIDTNGSATLHGAVALDEGGSMWVTRDSTGSTTRIRKYLWPSFEQVVDIAGPTASNSFATMVTSGIYGGGSQEWVVSRAGVNVMTFAAEFPGIITLTADLETEHGVTLENTLTAAGGMVKDGANNVHIIMAKASTLTAYVAMVKGSAGLITNKYTFALQNASARGFVACYVPHTNELAIVGRNDGGGLNDYIYFVDPANGDLNATMQLPGNSRMAVFENQGLWQNGPDSRGRIWFKQQDASDTNYFEIDLVNRVTLQSIDLSDWAIPTPTGLETLSAMYDTKRRALWVEDAAVLYQLSINRATGNGDTLEEITQEYVDLTALTAANDLDATAVSGVTIKGALYDGGSVRDFLLKLYARHQANLIDSDWELKGKLRGGASVATIPAADMGASIAGNPVAALDRGRGRALNRSKGVALAYISDKDYEINSQSSNKFPTEGPNQGFAQRVYPGVLSDDEARQAAKKAKQLETLGRITYDFQLGPHHLALESGDIVTISDGDENPVVEIQRQALQTDWVYRVETALWNDASLTAAGEGQDTITDAQTVPVLTTAEPLILDTPLFLDSHEATTAILYIGALFPAGDLSRPVQIQRATSAEGPWIDYALLNGGVQFGYLNAALAEGSTTTFDRTNTLDLTLVEGSLSSLTEAEVLASGSANPFVAFSDTSGAWELGQYATATLQGDGSYHLTSLLRGKRNTENHMGSATGRRVLFPTTSSLAIKFLATPEIGTTYYYRAIVTGAGAGAVVSYTALGRSKYTYSPAHAAAVANGNDWDFSWTRRSRFESPHAAGGEPLAEAVHSYEIAFLDGPEGAELDLKTVSATVSPPEDQLTNTVTEAELDAAYGTAPASYDVAIYQIGDFGRGEPAYLSVS